MKKSDEFEFKIPAQVDEEHKDEPKDVEESEIFK